ncbi:hypothetical protein BGX38DRAFT_63354 [Terfezia claveryi]|nr:hypothetical protein BGX38DRAFT_63354 [Terfezia claveryi]
MGKVNAKDMFSGEYIHVLGLRHEARDGVGGLQMHLIQVPGRGIGAGEPQVERHGGSPRLHFLPTTSACAEDHLHLQASSTSINNPSVGLSPIPTSPLTMHYDHSSSSSQNNMVNTLSSYCIDFELFAPENVVPQSYHNHQSFHTNRGVSTATSTPAVTSHHITRSLISPTLSSVGNDDFPSISSISYSTTSISTPTSRKRPTPTLPIEDSFPTPPPSSKIRKITSSTSTPSMKNLDESTRARSHRSQSPSQILASAVEEDTVTIKRARNTLAARRYRQKRVEKLEELEGLLAEAEKEKERYKEEAVRE